MMLRFPTISKSTTKDIVCDEEASEEKISDRHIFKIIKIIKMLIIISFCICLKTTDKIDD